MSEIENSYTLEQETPEIKQARKELLEQVFKHYHEFIYKLRQLPIQQGLPIVQKAYMDIDTGIVLIKEILNNTPLKISQPANENEK